MIVRFFIIFCLLWTSAFAEQKDVLIESKIIEKVVAIDPLCSTCKLIIQKTTSPWIKNHTLYQVITFDLLPPPSWYIAVNGVKEIFLLDRRNLDDWNEVISHEKVDLNNDGKVIDYAKLFISFTMNQSTYIDSLLPGEIKRIEAKEKKKVDTKTKIVRTKDRIQVVFYAKDSQGEIQQWNMILNKTGEIIKLQERSF